MDYAQKKIKAEEILKHANELKKTTLDYDDIYELIEDYNDIADDKSLITIPQLRNLIYSQKKLKAILKRVIRNLKAFVKSPSPKPLKKTLIYIFLFIVFSILLGVTSITLYEKYSNSIEKNQKEYSHRIKNFHLAESILNSAINIDIKDSNTGYEAASCINNYNLHAKDFNLKPTFPFIESIDIDILSKRLQNSGKTKFNTVIQELSSYVKSEKELLKDVSKPHILKETIKENAGVSCFSLIVFLGDLCTILHFLFPNFRGITVIIEFLKKIMVKHEV